MWQTVRKNYWFRQVGIVVAGAAFAGYFAFYAVQGDRGLMSLIRDRHRLAEAQQSLANVVTDRETLEKRVQGLHGQSLDLDLVDEVARKVLNLSRDKDMIIHQSDKE
jgi:cell division protein FtsB